VARKSEPRKLGTTRSQRGRRERAGQKKRVTSVAVVDGAGGAVAGGAEAGAAMTVVPTIVTGMSGSAMTAIAMFATGVTGTRPVRRRHGRPRKGPGGNAGTRARKKSRGAAEDGVEAEAVADAAKMSSPALKCLSTRMRWTRWTKLLRKQRPWRKTTRSTKKSLSPTGACLPGKS
jgi:hypothetical protein